MKPLSVTHFSRRPAPGAFSIERVFQNMRDAISSEVDVFEHQNANLSQGILPRFKDAWAARAAIREVNHVVGDVHYITYFLPRKRTILTIHDTILVDRERGLKRFILWLFWIWLPLKRCEHITTISEESRNRLIALVHINSSRITVIPDPVAPEFKPVLTNPITSNFRLLHIGGKKNKNLERTLRVLAVVPNIELTVIGHLQKEQEQLVSSLLQDFRLLGNVDEITLMNEYARADALMFVSLDEGFGLPILEAQAVGRPVITSARAPMNEVAGDAAMLVDPEDEKAMKDAVLRLITDPEQRSKMVERGFANVERFSAVRVAAQYVDLYRHVSVKADHV